MAGTAEAPGVDTPLPVRRAYILAETRAIRAWIDEQVAQVMELDLDGKLGEKTDPARLISAISSAGQAKSRALGDEAKRLGVDKVQDREGNDGETDDAAKWQRERQR
jgi:hypothetical protein